MRWNFVRLAETILMLASLGATAALGQTSSHLMLTGFTGPASINFGGTGTYTAVIRNAGPNDAIGVRMDATLPTLANGRVRLTATSTNCTKVSPDPNGPLLPCNLPVINEFASITATFTIQLPLPAKPYTFPCPVPFTMGPTTVVVTATNDTNPPGDSRTVNSSSAVQSFADIQATLAGPAGANEGDTVQYQAAVINLGPCRANDVTVTSGAAGGIIFGSSTGDCTSFPCALGIIDPGTSKNFTSTYTIDKLPEGLKSTGDPNSITARSAATPLPDGGTLTAATFDPDVTNNTASTQTVVQRSGGCSLSGGSLLAGLPVLLLLLSFVLHRRPRG